MPISSEQRVTLGPEEFRLLRDFVSGFCGLWFDDDSAYFLERRLQQRLRERQLESFLDYYYFLLYGAEREEELARVVDVLTTNETYFFREMNQLHALTEEILPELVQRREARRRLRFWSAGCSTGEEPYTLAILLLEHPLLAGWETEIFASDISQRVLQVARRGVYTPSSFRSTEPGYQERYFEPVDAGSSRVAERVRRLVTFGQLNLLAPEQWSILGQFDVILCRNVMIYFNGEGKRKMVGSFHRKLDAGGFLLLGHAESLMNVTTAFTLRHFKHDMVYQKPETAARQAP
ncbi:MAG TPA: protein-glutamate O-methyltransferase CheR [Candidatus Methanoperedens sp.]|nr:protein-glutamate O-methyltransferase CheR [Candidatus Methanoperedens sp.]